jgi:hypothetical protein
LTGRGKVVDSFAAGNIRPYENFPADKGSAEEEDFLPVELPSISGQDEGD